MNASFLSGLAAAVLALSLPASAESIAAAGSSVGSSASSAGSASLNGSSNSIEGSSTSSTGDKTALVKDGTYRVAAIAPGHDAGTLRLTLEPQDQAGAQPFVLKLPAQAFGAQAPVVGELVQAQHRAYGVQFARAEQPFFLVLAEAWTAELDSRPITP
ncbi:hypothetical protein CCO03_01220 [Comamonas serinivorans]|uniref:Uncharacterized protein n=1 Tax=Comamonas serinivorans TaxID=1082851 RepID=A0A1Y0EIN2_9BURK|nr:hypothetical protein [Comamonas serinivorans]ARU03485.1 hypothetical protein CCO03_01220 [Comamonas serinivorans]